MIGPGLLTSVDQLDEPEVVRETFVATTGARVLWADYATIASDFGFEPPEGHPARDEVDRWLVEQCARVSEAQLANDLANTAIGHRPGRATGYRPPNYGRAAVFAVERAPGARGAAAGLIDVKGCGVRDRHAPEIRFHRTGLLPLREALRELVLQRVVEAVFGSLGLCVRGVPLYAVLQLGFDAKIPGGALEPAALLLRRAHLRPPGNIELSAFGSESHRAKIAMELLLRRYGLTSANPRGCLAIRAGSAGRCVATLNGEELAISASHARQLFEAVGRSPLSDVINVQTTRQAAYPALDVEVVDFGHYYTGVERFDRPLVSLVSNLPLNLGCVFMPGHRGLSQPLPGRRLGVQFASRAPPPEAYDWAGLTPPPEVDGLTIYVASLARDLFLSRVSRPAVEASIAAFIGEATAHLRPAADRQPPPAAS